jgi:serine/threonine protein kinase
MDSHDPLSQQLPDGELQLRRVIKERLVPSVIEIDTRKAAYRPYIGGLIKLREQVLNNEVRPMAARLGITEEKLWEIIRSCVQEAQLESKKCDNEGVQKVTKLTTIYSGKYGVWELIGEGAMGSVYKALDQKLNRVVALKVVHAHLSSDPSFLRRFLREARDMARLPHENIVTIFSVEQDQSTHYLVMEYFAATNLRDIINNIGVLPLGQAVDIMRQIANALSYAHAHGIIHRDVKPANILVGEKNRAKLTDFGIAAVLDHTPPTSRGQIIGSLLYMSPEQARDATLDGRSDLYSFGMTFYEMLTGINPRRNLSNTALLRMLLSEENMPALHFPSSIPANIQDLIKDLLQYRPVDRIQDAGTLLDRLETLRFIWSGQSFGSPGESDEATTVIRSTKVDEGVAAVLSPQASPSPLGSGMGSTIKAIGGLALAIGELALEAVLDHMPWGKETDEAKTKKLDTEEQEKKDGKSKKLDASKDPMNQFDFESLGTGRGTDFDPRSEFHLKLEGEHTEGNRVECGTDVDLLFAYAVPTGNLVAVLRGEKLDQAMDQSLTIDMTVIPHGLHHREPYALKPAKFINGQLLESVRFPLRANPDPTPNAGCTIVFRIAGLLLYECFAPIELCQGSMPRRETSRQLPVPELNLDEIAESIKDRSQRDYVLTVWSQNGAYHVTRERNGDILPLLSPNQIYAGNLTPHLQRLLKEVSSVADYPIFSNPHHALYPGDAANTRMQIQEAMAIVATEGWRLYSTLCEDREFRSILEEMNQLPPGSTISIHAQNFWIPWEILYSENFNWKPGKPGSAIDSLNPQLFWGYRYVIESRLIGGTSKAIKYQTKAEQKRVFVILNVNNSIDATLVAKPDHGLRSHRTFFAEQVNARVGEFRSEPKQIKSLLECKDCPGSLIYFYCHGRSENPFDANQTEQLEIGPDTYIDHFDLPQDGLFADRPLVFLNSCSSGAISPLSLSNFPKKFKANGAEGLLFTHFSVPVNFGAAFGQEIIKRYLNGESIGRSLLDLRQNLCDKYNPLGLFYGLQCPADLKAPNTIAGSSA